MEGAMKLNRESTSKPGIKRKAVAVPIDEERGGGIGLMLVLVALLLAMAVVIGGILAQPASAEPAESCAAAPRLVDGERLDYEVHFGSIPAGHAQLVVEEVPTSDGGIYRIKSTARSNDVVSLFFPVRDEIVAEVDAETYATLRFDKRLREGPFKRDESFIYGDDGIVRSGDRTFEIEPGTRDILSALYYVRGMDLEVGDRVAVRAFEGGKSYDALVDVLRRERVETDCGDYECLVVRPQVMEGPFAKTGDMLIWLTDDCLKLPVMLKSRVSVGSFVARLVSWRERGESS
jgi:hypothetical protein